MTVPTSRTARGRTCVKNQAPEQRALQKPRSSQRRQPPHTTWGSGPALLHRAPGEGEEDALDDPAVSPGDPQGQLTPGTQPTLLGLGTAPPQPQHIACLQSRVASRTEGRSWVFSPGRPAGAASAGQSKRQQEQGTAGCRGLVGTPQSCFLPFPAGAEGKAARGPKGGGHSAGLDTQAGRGKATECDIVTGHSMAKLTTNFSCRTARLPDLPNIIIIMVTITIIILSFQLRN